MAFLPVVCVGRVLTVACLFDKMIFVFFTYFTYMYTFLIVLHSLKKCKPCSLLEKKFAYICSLTFLR